MSSRLPSYISEKDKICIICEGNEEYDYLDKLKSLGVWNERYDFFLENAEGNGNIPARYQDKYQNGSYDLVLIFWDTEKKPYEQYEDIKNKVNALHGQDKVADEIIIFGNPCTMQIVLLHIKPILLKSPAKKTNSPYIKSCFGVDNYKGRKDQRDKIFAQITESNYHQMCTAIQNLPTNDTVVGSTNFLKYINYFSSASDEWILSINALLEQE